MSSAHPVSNPSDALVKLAQTLLILSAMVSPLSAWAQLSITIDSPQAGGCVSNNPAAQPGGGPGEDPEFIPSDVSFTFTFIEPNGDDVSLTATINGVEVELNNSTVFPEGPGVPTTIDYLSIIGSEAVDGENLTLELTAASPAGVVSDSVLFDLDRSPPLIQFTPEQLALLAACDADAVNLINSLSPTVIDDYDSAPTLSSEVFQDGCSLTRVFTARDSCGEEGNSQDLFFQMQLPSTQAAEIYFSGAEHGEFYLETYSYFGVLNESCFEVNGALSVDDQPANPIANGTFLTEPGSYSLTVTAQDCAGLTYSEQADFELLEKPYADAGGPYVADQGSVITLDGGDSFCPPELGGIVEYAWDFDLLDDGDGGYINLGRTVDFARPNGDAYDDGVYTVGLRTTTLSGEVRYANTTVTISDAPPQCDPGGPYEVQQGVLLTFDGEGSSPGTPSEPILAYKWDFGEFEGDLDEQFAPNLTAPEYFYSGEGEYTVTLTVYDIDSECSAETTVLVTDVSPIVRGLYVIGVPPRLDPPYLEGDSILFSAGTTSAGSPAEPIKRFIWDWGDGNVTRSNLNESLRRPEHTFVDSGVFNVCLTVTDEDSDDTGCINVEIEDLKPRVYFEGDGFAVEGEEAHFSIARTRAGGPADPLSYGIIDWGDGTTTRVDDFSVTDYVHRFEADGDLTIRFTVFDEELDDPIITEAHIYVGDVSPRPEIRQVSLSVEEGLESVWSASDSEAGAPSDPIISYTWDWGDNSTSVGEEATHTYADNGTYLVQLTAEDSDGSLSTSSRFVSVRNRAPFNAQIIADDTRLDFGEPSRFEVSFEDVPNDVVSIFWRMGSGNATYTNRRVVNHAYREIGVFTIRVLLTDDDGGETELELDVEVTPAGPRIFLPELDEISEGETLSFEAELRAAETGEGGLDGPVELRVLRAPPGMTWTPLESANPQLSNRFAFSWETSAGDAGEHMVRLLGASPSGIERVIERIVRVNEAKELNLATVGGDADRAIFTLFAYPTDQRTRQTDLARIASTEIGRGIGQMVLERDQYFVSVPGSGVVAVIDARSGEQLRAVPIGDEPYALAASGDYIWGFDGRRAQVFAIDRRLKIYRRSLLDGLSGYVIAAQGVSTSAGDRIAILSSRGEALLLNPEAFVSNQPSRAITHRIDLAGLINPQRSSALLDLERESADLNGGDVTQAPSGGGLLSLSSDELIAYTTRGVALFKLDNISADDRQLTPLWLLRSAPTIESLTAHQGELWTASSQGLRKFAWPADGQGLDEEMTTYSGVIIDQNRLNVVSSVPSPLMGESTLILTTPRELVHLGSDTLRPLLTTTSVSARQILVSERDTRDE